MFKDQAILITGGTGSWGQSLTSKLLEQNLQKNSVSFRAMNMHR